MAISNEDGNAMVMPVSPMYGGGNNGFGFGSDWIVLFLLFAVFGGWGGNGWGGNGGFNSNTEFPWLLAANNNTGNLVTNGFDYAATTAQLNGIQSAISNGFANAEITACGRAADAMATAYNNQIASMNQNFANQQALDARLGSMEMVQQNCCCENRAAIADLKYNVATEACADRNAISQALSSVIEANTASTQKILDKMCQQELDAERRENETLRTQLNMQNLAASQAAQTAQLLADNAAQTQYVVNRVAPYPIPAFQVANPYGYNAAYGCACGV